MKFGVGLMSDAYCYDLSVSLDESFRGLIDQAGLTKRLREAVEKELELELLRALRRGKPLKSRGMVSELIQAFKESRERAAGAVSTDCLNVRR